MANTSNKAKKVPSHKGRSSSIDLATILAEQQETETEVEAVEAKMLKLQDTDSAANRPPSGREGV